MKWFRVEVSDEQGQIVAIESEMLTGRCDMGDAENEVIEKAIRHLSGFIGASSHPQEKDAGRWHELFNGEHRLFVGEWADDEARNSGEGTWTMLSEEQTTAAIDRAIKEGEGR